MSLFNKSPHSCQWNMCFATRRAPQRTSRGVFGGRVLCTFTMAMCAFPNQRPAPVSPPPPVRDHGRGRHLGSRRLTRVQLCFGEMRNRPMRFGALLHSKAPLMATGLGDSAPRASRRRFRGDAWARGGCEAFSRCNTVFPKKGGRAGDRLTHN